MSKVQLLIPTMHQTDMDIVERMNIQTDATIANQADRYDYDCLVKEGIVC